MSGAGKTGGGGGRGQTRMVPPPLGRGTVPLRRGPGMMKDRGRVEEVKAKGLGSNGGGIGVSVSSSSQEEIFQLKLTEDGIVPLYAMAIRLTPGLLETLKRVEELGEVTTMKFGVHSSGGHVIRVGDEEFRFSSAPEPGELCDIFEEQRRGEDGNGLLVESGSVWRKLSVQRTLNANEKDRVKMRSVEAERIQKSRKSIILDHNNTSFMNKSSTPADVNGRRAPPLMKGKKEPPQKKRKLVTTSPVVHTTPAMKSRPVAEKPTPPVTMAKVTKPAVAVSPELPASNSRVPAVQATPAPNKAKSSVVEEATGSAVQKPNPVVQRDRVTSQANAAGVEAGGSSKAVGVLNMTELRNFLITLLMDNPRGMTLKAVEKAVGEAMPNVHPNKKQMEKMIRSVASFHAPGKYMLKEGVEKGTFTKPSPGSGSSPETVPVESPPLADSPPLTETVVEPVQDVVSSGEIRGESSALHPLDNRKVDGVGKSSSHPLQRGGESAMSRAIRKAGEIVRSNAERLQPGGQDKAKVGVEVLNPIAGGGSTAETATYHEPTEVDNVSVGGDESPDIGSPENDHHGKSQGLEMDSITPDLQKPSSPTSHGVGNKKDGSDGSSSSSSSGSGSDSESDSDSESGSGSGSDSDSDSDSDGSSSSASEEENMDEDVDIVSDDEDKVGGDAIEGLKQKVRSKDARVSLQRQESKALKQTSRLKDHHKKQKHKTTDVVMSPHGSEDVDIGDAAEGVDTIKMPSIESPEKIDCLGATDNLEVDVDVISCDGGSHSPQEIGEASPAESQKHNDGAYEASEIAPDGPFDETVKEVPPGPNDPHTAVQRRIDSESDHSIEEYETRAENSGVRGARVKGDPKDENTSEAIEKIAEVSPSKSKTGTRNPELMDIVERESRSDCSQAINKGRDLSSNSSAKEHPGSAGLLPKLDAMQKSLLGTPPFPRDNLDHGGPRMNPGKIRGVSELKKLVLKEVEITSKSSRDIESGEITERTPEASQRPSQRSNRIGDTANRISKHSEVSSKLSGDADTPMKGMEGLGRLSRSSEDSSMNGRGPDMKDITPSDTFVKASCDGEVPERPEAQRRPNREAGLLGKPGKSAEFVGRVKEPDLVSGLSREKDGNVMTRPGREAKQLKKSFDRPDGFRKIDLQERGVPVSESGEKSSKDCDPQRKLSRDGDSWRRSPLKDTDSGSRVGNEAEAAGARLRDSRKVEIDPPESKGPLQMDETAAAKDKEFKMSSDLELGELRDLVAGEDLKGKEMQRSEVGKWKETSDFPPRQQPSKVHISPEKEKPRKQSKQVLDIRKPSMPDTKKQLHLSRELHKVDASISTRDTGRQTAVPQKIAISQEENGPNRVAEAMRIRATFGDLGDKSLEGRSGKRLGEDSGILEPGRPPKRPAVGLSQVSTVGIRPEPDLLASKQEKAGSTGAPMGKPATSDMGKGFHGEGLSQPTALNSKTMPENGRVPGLKSKGHEVAEKDTIDRRGNMVDGKQKTIAGLLGPGSKRDASGTDASQTNGKKRSSQTGDVQGRDFFAPYERKAPELRGFITTYDQYVEYCKEFNEKYPVYVRLNTVLDSDKEDFENFSRDILLAKSSEDKNRLQVLYGKVRKDYLQCRKRFRRMQKAFLVLHDELRTIKQRCKDYAEKVGQG